MSVFRSNDIRVTIHIPVLPSEVLEGMNPQPGDTVVDGTLGGGGHSRELLKLIGPGGRLFGFDRDPGAIERTRELITEENATFVAAPPATPATSSVKPLASSRP